MSRPFEDPIVREKHRAQKSFLKEAGGDLRKYNEIVRRKADEVRKKHPGHFTIFSASSSIAA
jgi:hypothetical protein